jgi:hypothetical protein
MQISYLDPASGSIVASALVGGAAAFGVAARSASRRITGVFKKKSTDDPEGASTVVSTGEDAPVESDT